MSDKMRWRYGETNPVVAPVDAVTTIDVGDLVYLSSGKAKSASTIELDETVAETQAAFTAAFLGVAMQKSVAGSTAPVRVATSGVFEFDASADTYALGNLVGVYESAADAAPDNQKVAKVAATTAAVGRIARVESTASAVVLVDVHSVIMRGALA